MPKVEDPRSLLTADNKSRVRIAHAAGKDTVKLNNRLFKIKLVVKDVQFVSGGQHHKAVEKWLNVKPADGAMVPMAMIELDVKSRSRLGTPPEPKGFIKQPRGKKK